MQKYLWLNLFNSLIMTPKYSLKQIVSLSKEICKSLDDNYEDIYTSDAYSFALNIQILIDTIKDMEEL